MNSRTQAVKSRSPAKGAAARKTAAGKKPTKQAAAKKPRSANRKKTAVAEAIEAPAATPAPQDTALSSTSERGCRILRFGSSCTLQEAAPLRAALIEQLSARAPLVLDASGIERIDTAGVQMLVGLSIECMERDIAFCWKGRSAAVEHAVGLLGVGALMESPGSVDQFAGLV